MNNYIEHNGHKVVLSIALEKKGEGWQTTMYIAQAADMTSLINELDKAKSEYAEELNKGASLVVDVQDYTSPEDAKDLFYQSGDAR